MKNKLLAAVAVAGILCMGARADFAEFSGEIGYMNVYEINGTSDGPGAYQFGDFWGVPDLKTVTADALTFELFPNVNTYANSLGGNNDDRAYWTNSDDGGLTPGPDGNKWMIATTLREHVLLPGETVASLDFSVGAFDLDSRYTLTAFVKTLDPLTGYGVSAIDSAVISGTMGTTTLSINSLVAGEILQIGYEMQGINANPTTDWGSAVSTLESVNVIPEPATIGLLGIAGLGMFVARRRFMI